MTIENKKRVFLSRFDEEAKGHNVCLEGVPIHAHEVEWNQTFFREERTSEKLKTVRWFTLRYTNDDVKKLLNGNGEAYMGSSEEFMEPYLFETLDVTIPSDDTNVKHVWKLYEEWLIKWTPAKKLIRLVDEPIEGEMNEKGSEKL